MENQTSSSPLPRKELIKMAIRRFLGAIIVIPAFFFLTAWTFDYWQAWIYLGIIFIPMIFIVIYLIRNDPALMERRFRMREKTKEQWTIVRISWIFFAAAFILPGFDVRFGWSQVPVTMVIAADLLVFLGYMIFFRVLRENSYLSRIVEVMPEQKVISSGPYAFVRHPMYLGTILMYVFSPLALGSFWALIPAVMIIPVLVARSVNEEKLLVKDLPGYEEYMQKVKYRLFPGIW